MKVHPREAIVEGARRRIELAVAEVFQQAKLTTAEQIRVITAVMAGELQGIAKYAIRQERHGDSDTPGGLA